MKKCIVKKMLLVTAAVGIIASMACSSIAATSVSYYLYGAKNTANAHKKESKSIDATGTSYYGICISSTNGSSVYYTVPNAAPYTLTGGQGHTFTRSSASPSGDMTVSFSMIGGDSQSEARGGLSKS